MTLLARDLFASGSADGQPGVRRRRCSASTAALNKVPGRVLVVGHTDDQPIKSLRYQDNFELSRERAVSVVDGAASRRIDNRARLSWTGVGSSQPRYRPGVGSGEPGAQSARGNHPRARHLTVRRDV